MAKRVVVAVNDLMLAPRFLEAAKRLGFEARRVGSASAAVDACADAEKAVVLVDLHDARLHSAELFGVLRERPNVTTVGFHGHMMPELGQRAKDAGCSIAMSRGELVDALDGLLRDALS